ncbi:flagellar protein FlgN [Cohaesibacter marisflavi]|uniref:flagellar protein FlgN n=1 Tax=Cohaesibacter marisflavi TaxID=655353 RepID=UPI0029C66F08|nr:flagellar protein FlgN [Cohaesibacter marisflavi]
MQTSIQENTGQSVDLAVVPEGATDGVQTPLMSLSESEERILECVQRAIRAVSRETKALREEKNVDLRAHSDEKSRILLELSRLTEMVDVKTLSSSVTSELLVLRKLLDENQKVLQKHLEAVREITEVLSKAMLAAESDGTYGAQPTE